MALERGQKVDLSIGMPVLGNLNNLFNLGHENRHHASPLMWTSPVVAWHELQLITLTYGKEWSLGISSASSNLDLDSNILSLFWLCWVKHFVLNCGVYLLKRDSVQEATKFLCQSNNFVEVWHQRGPDPREGWGSVTELEFVIRTPWFYVARAHSAMFWAVSVLPPASALCSNSTSQTANILQLHATCNAIFYVLTRTSSVHLHSPLG